MPYSRLFYHIVWTTHQRQPLISPANEAAIYLAIRQKVFELRGIVHAANGMSDHIHLDHIHLVLSIPPSLALAKVVGQLKGCSSYVASRITGNAQPFAWQREYGILSVSESHLPSVIEYVELQKHHHAENKLNPRLEATTVTT